MKTVVRTTVMAILVGTLSVQAAESFYIEAESVSPATPWEFTSETAGYFGEGYLYYPGPDKFGKPNGILPYTFTIDKEGEYRVTIRGRRDREGVCENSAGDQCNDVFTKLNDGSWKKTLIKYRWGNWIWKTTYEHGRPEFNLKPGTHTFYIAGRSKGMKIDAIRIWLRGTPAPEGPKDVAAVVPAPALRTGSPIPAEMKAFAPDGSFLGRAMEALDERSLKPILITGPHGAATPRRSISTRSDR